MRLRPVGARAVLLEVEDGPDPTARVQAWQAAVAGLVERGELVPPVDLVPGARTLLLDGVDVARTAALLRALGSPPAVAARADTPPVEVPVVYDGADLAQVAALWGTDEQGVVDRHTAATFQVAFCGFAPGFPYMTGLDADVPRLDTPRGAVPAGSVALAGRYCGIYPRVSPGGWQLLGRTDAVLFDAERDPPALLPPGARARFVAVGALGPARPGPGRRSGEPATRSFTVLRAGPLSTVQDAGRPGLASVGATRSGALDTAAARLANRLVGNPEDAAVLETTVGGVALRASCALTVAVTGATAAVTAGGRAVDPGTAVGLGAGEVLEVGPALTGVRSYVAVGGGLDLPAVLGSRSSDTLSGLGPEPLTDGDVLPVGPLLGWPPGVDVTVPVPVPDPLVLHLHPGPRDDWYGPEGLAVLAQGAYEVSPLSNRIGARLRGPALTRVVTGELESEGIVVGAVQVPPDGQPVVLLVDHPDDRRLPGRRRRRPGRRRRAGPGPPRHDRALRALPAPARPDPGGPRVTIDLNSDLGEGFGVWRLGDDDALLGIVSSANAACGFHAGDPSIMRTVTARAAGAGVAVGAQVSYRDLAGFGRRRMDVAPAELTADVLYQIGALDAFCRVAGDRVRYVKPHGALYNTAVVDEGQAKAVVRAVQEYDSTLPVLGLPGSALLHAAEAAGLTAVAEGFVDRGYTPEGHLVPRSRPDALVTDEAAVVERAVRMAESGTVVAVDGSVLHLPVRSLCVHGDTPGAVGLARRVRAALEAAGLPPTAFA